MGQLLQNLYNSVDAIVVGNFVGTTALAAVSSSVDIAQLIVGFFSGLSAGAGVLFSMYFGAKDQKMLHVAIHTTLTFSFFLGLVMVVVGILLTPVLLRTMACPEDVWAEAALYLRIYMVGILFTSIYNISAGILRAVGNSRAPFFYLAVASGSNVVLDFISVNWLGMGVAGVALATIISQLLSVILIFRDMLLTNDVYKISLRDLRINKQLLLKVLGLGLPAGIQNCLIAISNVFVQRYVNMFGSAAMAGIGAGKKIDKYAGLTSNSIGLASATFISQNLGAKQNKRAIHGLRICLLLCSIVVSLIAIPIYSYASAVIRIFTADEQAVFYGVAMIRTIMPFMFLNALVHVFANAVRGFGKSRVVMVMMLIGMVGCRQLFLHLAMQISFDVKNVFYAYPVGWGSAGLLILAYYILVIRRNYHKWQTQENSSVLTEDYNAPHG